MKKYIYKISLLSISLWFITSCDFGDTNIDPSNPIDAPVSTLLPTIEARMAYFLGGDMARYNALFTQHFAGTARQHLTYSRYIFDGTNTNTTWNQMYGGAFRDMRVVLEKAQEEGQESPHYSGVTKVLLAVLIGNLSDLFGNIPYSEAALGDEQFTPSYDSRDDIYASIHQLLGEARTELAATESLLSPAGDDLIYGGDLDLWIKASHALDARYYLHRGDLASAVASAAQGFDSSDEDMEFVFGSGETEANPLYQWLRDRNDTNLGAFFVGLMASKNDPRLPVFATIVDTDGDGVADGYVGATAGLPGGTESQVGAYLASPDSPVPFITYTEQKFIEAEALLITNAAEAAEAFDEAITASMLEVTGAPNEGYVAVEGSDGGTNLERIQTQKYIALFYQVETFNEFRRTGIPDLRPAASSALPGGEIISRWPYPQDEALYNRENYEANRPENELIADLNWD